MDDKCSFCGKSEAQVEKMITGPGVYICNECVSLCVDIMAEEGVELSRVEELSHAEVVIDKQLDAAGGERVSTAHFERVTTAHAEAEPDE